MNRLLDERRITFKEKRRKRRKGERKGRKRANERTSLCY